MPAEEGQEPHQWQVNDTFVIDNGGVPVRGQVTGVGEDGVEICTERPVNGKKMQVVSPEELQGMARDINAEALQPAQEEAERNDQLASISPNEQSEVSNHTQRIRQ